jgi:hypothetical protein
MSNKKQTAVEWLFEQLINIDRPNYTNRRILAISKNSLQEKKINELVEQAKEMEKQQIIDFANNFIDEHTYGDYDGSVQTMITVKQYYNENYEI